MGPGRSSSLHIGGDSSAVTGSGRTGGVSDRSAGVDKGINLQYWSHYYHHHLILHILHLTLFLVPPPHFLQVLYH